MNFHDHRGSLAGGKSPRKPSIKRLQLKFGARIKGEKEGESCVMHNERMKKRA